MFWKSFNYFLTKNLGRYSNQEQLICKTIHIIKGICSHQYLHCGLWKPVTVNEIYVALRMFTCQQGCICLWVLHGLAHHARLSG